MTTIDSVDRDIWRLASQQLLDAYASGQPVDPIAARWPRLDINDAYEIQRIQVRNWQYSGQVVRGHKVGLSSAVMQRQMNVDQPDFGHLMSGMFFLEHSPIPLGRFLQPRVEPEVAFVLGASLEGPGVSVADAIRAVDCVLPAIEIIDSRIKDWNISIVDTIADNASSGGVVLGHRPRLLRELDLTTAGAVLRRNGEVVGTGAGGAILGSPLNSLVWLANTLGCYGVALNEGDVILPGSMTAAVPVHAGDATTLTVAGLGRVTVVFAATADLVKGPHD